MSLVSVRGNARVMDIKGKILMMLLALGMIVAVSGCISTPSTLNCAGENQGIITGTQYGNGNCCTGFVPKAPQGYTGGAWCVNPSCNVECLTTNQITTNEIVVKGGVVLEGIYTVCNSGHSAILLKTTRCPG